MNSIHTAILSYGMSGEVFHAPLIAAHGGFVLNTIVQRKSEHARKRYPQVKLVRDVEEVFSDSHIELVVVNTPNDTHYEYSRKAIEAGKHVVLEKPFTVTVEEADKLIALAARHDRMIAPFQNRRWDGGFLTVQKIIKEGKLGKIAEYESHYDRFRNYIQPDTWKEVSTRGTGILYNLGSHMIDQVLVLFGLPKEVDARIGSQREGGEVDDFYDIRLHYDGFLAIIKSSYLVCDPGPQYIIHGTQGSFTKYGIDPQEEALKVGGVPGSAAWGLEPKEYWGRLKTATNNQLKTELIETLPGNYLGFYENVFEVIRMGKPLAVQPQEAREVIRVIEACYESNRTHRAVALS
jgi:scyllo-inositol 2-dehydrogenase (NADP+)